MGEIDTSNLRKRSKIMIDEYPCVVVDIDFVKPGKGQAFNRVKYKNLITGRVVEKTFKAGVTVPEADVTFATMEYLYNDGENWSFMDTKSYEQIEIPKDSMDGADQWLLDNTPCEITFWGQKPIAVSPPIFMSLEITYTEPAVKGNTSTSVMKAATLQTGAILQVPLFMDIGMKIKVDTRTGEYVERAK